MKKKKSMIVLAIFVAVLVLGVGYAAISGVDLTISGTASTEDRDLKVSFEGTVNSTVQPNTDSNSPAATATGTTTAGSLSATISVANLSRVDQTATVTYTIQNEEEDVTAVVTVNELQNDKPDFFEVTTDIPDQGIEIAPGGTNTVTVTVRVSELPVSSDDDEATINILLRAEAK